MKKSLLTAFCVVSISGFSTLAQAQPTAKGPLLSTSFCPAAWQANPLLALSTGTWVFRTQSEGGGPGQASIGKFTATAVPPSGRTPSLSATGTLNIVETLDAPSINANPFSFNNVTPELQVPGVYQVNADCSGGTLYFNTAFDVIYAFQFANNFTEMYLVSLNSASPPATLPDWGVAKLIPAATPIVCPAGGPLSTIAGQTFGLGFGAGTYFFGGGVPAGVGIFTASTGTTRSGQIEGLLNGNLTFYGNVFGFGTDPTVQAGFGGTYAVDPDCSGGTVTFNDALPVQFQFVFTNSGFTQMYLLSLNLVVPMEGVATHF